MRVLLVGSGAREHALAYGLTRRAGTELHAAPGNPGISRHATCHPVPGDDVGGLMALAARLDPELVVVGPESPLVLGLADALRERGVPVFGPTKEAARIEGSKAFAKEVMLAAGVPTAAYRAFTDADLAEEYAASLGRAVVKADGLAAGKGVIVAEDAWSARVAVRSLMRDRAAGAAGARVVVEEMLEGEEVSAIALCDGERHLMLASAQDHKRLLDGDRGPNTGGMGAYSPAPALPSEAAEEIGERVIAPVMRELAARGAPFVGALFAGLMMTRQGPKVLEFNCRLGDPEAQPLLMRLETELPELLLAAAKGDLRGQPLRWRSESAVGIVLAARGYPERPQLGDPIDGLDQLPLGRDLQVFHAGTRLDDGKLVTAGGRVLTVCALGADLASARSKAYQAAERISFAGLQLRKDIGARGLGR